MAAPKCTRCGAPLRSQSEACFQCGSLLHSAPSGDELPAGSTIAGKYEIIDAIAEGGMGRVYRAIQQPLGTIVCVKTLHKGATADPQFEARFEREARTTSQLRHPNIVTVFDFGAMLDGSLYLVMEFVEGDSLAKLVPRGKVVSARRAVSILGQLCDALSFAHARGVIHRDLKPANIMLIDLPERQDHVKVLDFGSALLLVGGEEGERLTRVGTVIGTPAYMAPEYILGRGVDARIDVYAVGMLAYTLLTGGPAFRGDAQSVFAQQVSVPPEPPSKRNPSADVPPALEQVILRALVKDPARRFATAADLKLAMERGLEGQLDEETARDLVPTVPPSGSVAVAHEERSVVLVSVRARGPLEENVSARVLQVAQSHGAEIAAGGEALQLVLGLDREVPEAASEAARCAMELVAMDVSPPLRVGIRDAQASCRGRHGQPGFRYELFGEGTTLVEQLSAHAQPGMMLVSGPIARHAPADLVLTPVLPPDGVNEPVFAMTDPARGDGRLGQLAFVGRSEQQRMLLEIAASAVRGRVALLQGPLGIGKSRLVAEIGTQAARLGVLWAVVPASARPEVGPAHPVSRVAALGWTAPGGSASTTERYVVDVMLGRSDRAQDGLTGERRQLRLVAAAIDGATRRLEHGPVVVVLDDLQDADDLTWTLAKRLVDMASVLKLSVVLCVREGEELPFTLPTDAERIDLPPLSGKEVRQLASMAGLDEERLELVAERSQKNPLLAEEIVRTIARDAVEELDAIVGMSTRDAIATLLNGRVASLGPTGLALLRAAAALGAEPMVSEALTLAGVEHEPREPIAELRAAALARRTPAGRFAYAHALVRDVTLAAMTSDERREIHARAAELLQALGGAETLRLGEIGRHLYQAADLERAFDVLRRAAELAQIEGSTRRALQHLRWALAAGDSLGPTFGEARAQVARELGKQLIQAGELDEAELVLREAFPRAREQGAEMLAADLLRLHGSVLSLQGANEEGTQEVTAALGFAEKRGFATVAAEACGDLASAADRRGEREVAAEILRRGLALIEAREDAEAIAVRQQLYNRLGRQELQSQNFNGAIALFTQALALAERARDRYTGAGLLGNLGGAYAKRGEIEQALAFTEKSLRVSEALGDQIGVARQSFNLGLLRLSVGQGQLARQLLRSSYDAARRAGWREGIAMSSAALAKLGD